MRIRLIVVPYDSGRLRARMGLGPEVLASSELVDELRSDGHQVDIVAIRLDEGFLTEVGASVELMRRVSKAVAEARSVSSFPIVFSGNCGIGVGAVSGLGAVDTGVLWFDAHGDLNTPSTTASGFFDGTTFAMLLGYGWEALAKTIPGFSAVPADHAALLAGRDLDGPERELAARVGLALIAPSDFGTDEARSRLEGLGRRVSRLYVHLDLDCFDPSTLRASQYAADGGPDLEAVVRSIADAAAEAPIDGLGFASYDPAADGEGNGSRVVRSVVRSALSLRRDRSVAGL